MEYHYSTKQFGVSNDEIHFLRNHFPYDKISFTKVNRVELRKGMQLNNWFVVFSIGVALLIPGLYMLSHLAEAFESSGFFVLVRVVYYMAIPLIGVYFVYESLQYGPVIEISYENKTKKFHLNELTSEELIQLSDFMRVRIGSRFINSLT